MKKLLTTSIKVKKTKNFYLIILLMVLFFIMGYVHNNNLAYITLFFIFSFSLIGMILGRVNIKKAFYSLPDIRIFAGDKVVLPFKKEGDFFAEIENEVIFEKRGINKKEFLIKSSYPFKLAVFYKKIPVKVLVYPALKGESLKTAFFGKEENDFEGLKQYNYEDMKYIHWPSLAKEDLQVKVFGGKKKGRELVFDYSKIPGNKEDKISQLAKWAYEAYEMGEEFKIILPDMEINSKEGFDEVFKKLALY